MSTTSSNITSGFIDLATFDEAEKYLYGGPDATAYFVRETRKSTWFTQVPVVLSRASGMAGFGNDWSVSISRAADYLLAAWLRVGIPSVTVAADNQFTTNGRIRWTRNLMHNLVKECTITFNDLVAARFDSYHLDFWAAFTTPAGKRNGYLNMIGDVSDLTDPNTTLPAATLNLPLPLFFTRDSGVALPTAALPYNEMRINFAFRDWNELLILDDGQTDAEINAAAAVPDSSVAPTLADIGGTAPVLNNPQVWANYAIVSNDERKRMGCAPRDILIEQVQTAPKQNFAPASNPNPSYDIRFSHSIKVLFFAVRNKTIANDWSNYTTATNIPVVNASTATLVNNGSDPIVTTTLTYENTQRLASMGSDYFSLVNPWYHAPVIPLETGFHAYSYSLDFICLDPKGSTNYGKLTNVSILPEASQAAIDATDGSVVVGDFDSYAQFYQSGVSSTQVYDFICTVVNNNIIRIKNASPKYLKMCT